MKIKEKLTCARLAVYLVVRLGRQNHNLEVAIEKFYIS